jgi:transcriptional regulator with XRE-family HTH domain
LQKYPVRRRAVASVLRDARLAAGLSQRALSAKLGEVSSYACMIEAARQRMPADELLAWAEACNTRASFLMRRAERRFLAGRLGSDPEPLFASLDIAR